MSRRLLHVYRLYGPLSRQRIQVAHGMQLLWLILSCYLSHRQRILSRCVNVYITGLGFKSAQTWFATRYHLLPDWMLSVVVSDALCYPIGPG